jgi:hypothetical protein
VRAQVKCWKKWNQYWIDLAKEQTVPVYFTRFEDIMANPKQSLEEIFSVILEMENVEGTVVQQRIHDIVKAGKTGNTVYKPRKDGGVNKNLSHYS